jgi:hypothetical protein
MSASTSENKMAAFIKMAELGSFDKNVGIEQNKNPSSRI